MWPLGVLTRSATFLINETQTIEETTAKAGTQLRRTENFIKRILSLRKKKTFQEIRRSRIRGKKNFMWYGEDIYICTCMDMCVCVYSVKAFWEELFLGNLLFPDVSLEFGEGARGSQKDAEDVKKSQQEVELGCPLRDFEETLAPELSLQGKRHGQSEER